MYILRNDVFFNCMEYWYLEITYDNYNAIKNICKIQLLLSTEKKIFSYFNTKNSIRVYNI